MSLAEIAVGKVETLGTFAVELERPPQLATARPGGSTHLRLYSQLYVFAPIAYCTIDAREMIVDLNLVASALFGVERAWLINKPIRAVARSMDYQLLHSRLRSCLEWGKQDRFEMEVISRKGQRLLLEVQPYRLLDDAGAPSGCLLTVEDMTARADAEQALQFLAGLTQRLNDLLRSPEALTAVAEALVPFPATACIVSMQEPLISISQFGVSHADRAAGAVLEKLARAEAFPPTAKRALDSLGRGGEPLLVEQLGTADRTLIELDENLGRWTRDLALGSYVLLPLAAGGEHLGTLFLARDRATVPFGARDLPLLKAVAQRCSTALENVRLYQIALRAARLRDEFVAMVSHDLSNAISAVQLTASSMAKQETGGGRLKNGASDGWRRVENAATWMQRLIQRLLDISVIESNRLSVMVGPERVVDLLTPVLEIAQPSANAKSVSLRVEVSGEIWARADQERIQQVFSNLISNAIKFSPRGGTVTIRAKAEDRILVCVSDQGKGISAEEQKHIFDRFWQAKRTRRPGVGLGLAIARGIIRAHGGALWVESEVGRGSTFSFTLEACPPRAGAVRALSKKVARIAKL